MTPDLIVATISAGMQAMDLWLNFRDRSKASAAMDQIRVIQNSPENHAEAQRLLNLVPAKILDTFSGRVNRCFNNYSDVLKDDHFLPGEVDDATKALKKCVCRELSRLREINGRIPNGILHDLWNQYRCNLED